MNLFSTNVAYAGDSFIAFVNNANTLIINPIIKFLFALAVVYFLWGVFEFLLSQQSEEKKTSGKEHMLWGVVGITIMIGVWGILNVIVNTLGVSGQITPKTGEVNLKEYTPPN